MRVLLGFFVVTSTAVPGSISPTGSTNHEALLTVASLGLIAEHLSQPVCAKDRELRFVLINSAYCRLLGRERDELLGKTAQELGNDLGGNNEAIQAAEREVLTDGRPVSTAETFRHKDGRLIERLTTRIPLGASAGETTHVVCVVGEKGEVAASEEQLDEELERYAQERTRALRAVQDQLLRKERLMVLGQLAAGLAHQIRNPLSAISNAIALARRHVEESNTMARQALQIAGQEIWEANRIIRDLLDYARIRPPTRQIAEVREMVLNAVEAEPLPTGIHVEVKLDDLSVCVDERQVRDALRNLVRNAREAMDDHGTLSFFAAVDGDWVELSVQDTGVGVTAEHRHLLFEPLVTSKPLGIGLGLPTARALVMNQGGTLECVDSEGRGARFVVRLPITAPDEAPLSR